MGMVRATVITVMALSAAAGSAGAQEVLAGFDLWETVPDHTFYDLAPGSQLDLNVLCPGWQVVNPPNGLIPMRGVPIGVDAVCCPGKNLLATDTVVQRLEHTVGLEGGPDEVPIEICALQLQSIEPFTVQNTLSLEVRQWRLDVVLPTTPQPIGTMTITRNDASGGTFTSELPVQPRLVFTRVDVLPAVVECDVVGPIITFDTFNPVNWAYTPAPGKIEVPDCTSNFYSTDDFLLVSPNASHALTEPAAGPVPAVPSTWGRVKSLYR
jgi:hypothetical protein